MKVYDPILCMMVEKQDVKDANKYVDQAIKWLKEGKKKTEVLVGLQRLGLTPTDASKYLAEAFSETGYKYNMDNKSVKDEKTKTNDAAADDFKKAIQLVEQIRQITRKHSRNIDANALFAYCDKIQDKYQYYIDNAHRGWYD